MLRISLIWVLLISLLGTKDFQFGTKLKIKDLGNIKFLEIVDFKVYDQNIYLTDTRGQTVYKFNLQGKLLSSTGREGRGPGEFVNGPRHIAMIKDKIYVTSFMPWVLVYDKELNFLENKNLLKSPVNTYGLNSNENVIYIVPTKFYEENLFLYNPETEEIESIFLDFKIEPGLLYKHTIYSMGDKWLFAWHFKNQFKIFDKDLNYLNTFSIDGLPNQAKGRIEQLKRIPTELTTYQAEAYRLGTFIPEGTFFYSFAKLNEEHLLIQLGTLTGGDERALIVNLKGEVVQEIALPQKGTKVLGFANDVLYLFDRSSQNIMAYEFKAI